MTDPTTRLREIVEAATHDFDALSQFCVRCGCSRMSAANGADCHDGVIAISHLVRGKTLRAMCSLLAAHALGDADG